MLPLIANHKVVSHKPCMCILNKYEKDKKSGKFIRQDLYGGGGRQRRRENAVMCMDVAQHVHVVFSRLRKDSIFYERFSTLNRKNVSVAF